VARTESEAGETADLRGDQGRAQLSKLGYDKYIEFVWHSLAAVFLVCCACVGISAATS